MSTIIINYDLCEINLGDDSTSDDVDGWLDNLAALIASEFGCDVSLQTGYTGGRGTYSRDEGVNARLYEISSGDEWISLIPESASS